MRLSDEELDDLAGMVSPDSYRVRLVVTALRESYAEIERLQHVIRDALYEWEYRDELSAIDGIRAALAPASSEEEAACNDNKS